MTLRDPAPTTKVLVALLGFVARGPATVVRDISSREAKAASRDFIDLMRRDGAQRKVLVRLFKLTLERGLIVRHPYECASATPQEAQLEAYALSEAGRMALRRLQSDPESAFQTQHRHLVTKLDADGAKMTVNLHESPLAALARLKSKGKDGGKDATPYLQPGHVEAGERLRMDFTRGQMQPSLGQNWDMAHISRQSGGQGGNADLTETALSARIRVERALDAVGPELRGVLMDVCCFLKGLSEVERDRQWPARSAKLMLRTALAALERYYSQATLK